MDKTFTFIEDPGHGWLKVHTSDLWALGFGVTDFSQYSYRTASGKTLYLEEDCDAPKFINAWKAKFGEKSIRLEERYVNRFNRRLPSIY